MLPSVRAFAAQQGANPLTVAKAYQSFQDDGLVIVKRGVGMLVAEGATRRLLNMERAHFLQDVWPPIAAQMRRIGISLKDLAPNEEEARSEEHTSELQSLMRISYAVFCLKKKKTNKAHTRNYMNYT